MDSKQKVEKIIGFLDDKKARDISTINIREVSILADYFVICSGTSTTHIKTLADEVEFKMEQAGEKYLRREGYNSARWILLDYGDVVVHVFHQEDRQFYNLERLWAHGTLTRADNNLKAETATREDAEG